MKVSFSDQYKKNDFHKAPKLKVLKGAVDRVVILTQPDRHYVHQISMPIINPETGERVKETKKNAKGEEYEVDKMEFVSSTLCTGNQEVVAGPDGVDPENCPLCAAYVEHAGKFPKPQPKFASLVAKYKTGEGEDTTPQLDPFVAEVLLWVFTQNRFEKILAIAKEHGDPVQKKDLLCGPCNNELFQNYEVSVAGRCVYAESEDAKKFILASVKSSGIDETLIKSTIAAAPTDVNVKITINKVLERLALEGRGASGGTAVDLEFNGLAADSHNISERTESADPWGALDAKEAVTPDFVESTPASAEVPKTEAPASAPASDATPASLEDILAQLG